MRLVVDASVLVGELLRKRGKALFQNPSVEYYIAEATYDEAQSELLKRQRLLAQRAGLAPEVAARLVHEALEVAQEALSIIPNAWLEPFQDAALPRIPSDPNDWPSLALALTLDTGIWTEDRDFFGSGIATWQTPILQYALTESG